MGRSDTTKMSGAVQGLPEMLRNVMSDAAFDLKMFTISQKG